MMDMMDDVGIPVTTPRTDGGSEEFGVGRIMNDCQWIKLTNFQQIVNKYITVNTWLIGSKWLITSVMSSYLLTFINHRYKTWIKHPLDAQLSLFIIYVTMIQH